MRSMASSTSRSHSAITSASSLMAGRCRSKSYDPYGGSSDQSTFDGRLGIGFDIDAFNLELSWVGVSNGGVGLSVRRLEPPERRRLQREPLVLEPCCITVTHGASGIRLQYRCHTASRQCADGRRRRRYRRTTALSDPFGSPISTSGRRGAKRAICSTSCAAPIRRISTSSATSSMVGSCAAAGIGRRRTTTSSKRCYGRRVKGRTSSTFREITTNSAGIS
jgi:hypothetical protein